MIRITIQFVRYDTQDTSVPSGVNIFVGTACNKKAWYLQYWPCRSPTVCVRSSKCVSRYNDISLTLYDMHILCSVSRYTLLYWCIFTPLPETDWRAKSGQCPKFIDLQYCVSSAQLFAPSGCNHCTQLIACDYYCTMCAVLNPQPFLAQLHNSRMCTYFSSEGCMCNMCIFSFVSKHDMTELYADMRQKQK